MKETFEARFQAFWANASPCVVQVWNEMSDEQRAEGKFVLEQAWEEEDTFGFRYSQYQILANFLTKQILYPCYDAVFKAIFLDDYDNYVLLRDLISQSIFRGKKRVTSLSLLTNEAPIDVFGDKVFRCDILVVTDSKDQCNIEMQLAHSPGLTSRMVIQMAKLHASQAKRGFEPIHVKPTHSLWIMPFDFTTLPDYYNTARIRYDTEPHEIVSSDMQLHFFEFTKIGQASPADKTTKPAGLELWKNFFSMKDQTDCEDLKVKGELMEQAIERLASLSQNNHFRRQLLDDSLKELGRRIELGASFQEGHEKGLEEGLDKGREEGLELWERRKQISLLSKLFSKKLKISPSDIEEIIVQQSNETLDSLGDCIFSIDSIEELRGFLAKQ